MQHKHSFLAFLALATSLAAQPLYYTATLNGAAEVPPNASTAFGKALVVLNGTSLTVTVISTALTTPASAGHIHKGAVGVSGGVVIPFVQGPPNTWTASVTVTAAQITDLQAGLWYANLHSSTYTAGEIRGQIGPATAPAVYGAGCKGTNSSVPAIGANDFACIGLPFTITLSAARASTTAALILGTSNTTYGSLTLPYSLAGIGMPACSLLCSDLGLGLTAPTNASGAGSLTIPIPLNLGIAGLKLYSQWFPIDAGANLLGIVASNALAFQVQ